MEEQNFRGSWWLPGEFSDRVGGVLSYEPESEIKLELFETISGSHLTDRTIHRRLHGLTNEGERVNLYDCKRTKQRNQNGSTSSEYSAHLLTVNETGSMFNHASAFDQIHVSFPLVGRWTGFNSRPIPNNGQHPPPTDKISIESDIPDNIDIDVFDPALYLRMNRGWHVEDGSGSIDLTPEFVFSFRRPRVSFSEYTPYLKFLGDLIALGTGEPVRPDYIQGHNPQSTNHSRTQVSDIYHTYQEHPSINRTKNPHRFMFSLSDYPGNLSDLISDWFTMYSELGPVLHMYFGTMYNSSMYVQSKFLSLIQCIEGYYIRRNSNHYINSSQWSSVEDKLKNLLLSDAEKAVSDPKMVSDYQLLHQSFSELNTASDAFNFSTRHKDVIRGRISGLNRLSLRRKLKNLVQDHSHLLRNPSQYLSEKIHEIVESRHYYTHQLTIKNTAVAEYEELVRLSWLVQQLLEAVLLNELSISDSTIKGSLERKYSARSIA